MSHQINFNLNKDLSQQQTIMISWTNPSTDTPLLSHIKQEDELNIISQVIQEVPHPCLSDVQPQPKKSNSEVSKKLVKILPKNSSDSQSQTAKEKYFRLPNRKYAKRTSKSADEIIRELMAQEAEAEVVVIKEEKELQIISELPLVRKSIRLARKSIQDQNETTTKNISEDVFKKSTKIVQFEHNLFTIKKEPIEVENVKLGNIEFIQTKDSSGGIKLMTIPSKNLNFVADIKSDDDDSDRLFIKEEEELEIIDIAEQPAPKQSLECKICSRKFKRKFDMIRHKNFHAEAKYHCQKCRMKFKSELYFSKHKCIECQFCGEIFMLKQLQQIHLRKVHDIKTAKFECDLCGKRLQYRTGINYHMKKVHKQLDEKYECDICGKRFKLKELMRVHLKNHESVIECELCGRKVKQINLKVHMQSFHATTRDFGCTLCDQSFKTRNCAKIHMKTHEKSFKCLECDKKFPFKAHLTEHLEWHKNPDVFKCQVCSKTYIQRNCLRQHMKLHANGTFSKKHSCTICPYSTDKLDNLRKHELKHQRQKENRELKKNWLQCEMCPLKIKNKLRLASHYWKRHSEMMQE